MNEIFSRRHSVRVFVDKEIEPEKIQAILDAANSAPSAGNLKSREIKVISDLETKQRLSDATPSKQQHIVKAPVVLVYFAKPQISSTKYGQRGESLYCIQDATIAASFALLQAFMLDLGGCWVGGFDEDEVKNIFNNKDDKPICIMPVGYEQI